MDIVNGVLGAMHLPGATVLETIGAGASLYLGVLAMKAFIGFAQRALSFARSASRDAPAVGARRGRR